MVLEYISTLQKLSESSDILTRAENGQVKKLIDTGEDIYCYISKLWIVSCQLVLITTVVRNV